MFERAQVTALMRHVATAGDGPTSWSGARLEQRHGRCAGATMSSCSATSVPMPGSARRMIAVVGVFWPSKKFAESRADPCRRRRRGRRRRRRRPQAGARRSRRRLRPPATPAASRALVDRLGETEARATSSTACARCCPTDLGPDDDTTGELPRQRSRAAFRRARARRHADRAGERRWHRRHGAAPVATSARAGRRHRPVLGGSSGIFCRREAAAEPRDLLPDEGARRAGRRGLNVVLAPDPRNASRAAHPPGRPQLRCAGGHGRGRRPDAVRPASLTLLQGAFSHNGFAADFDGKQGRLLPQGGRRGQGRRARSPSRNHPTTGRSASPTPSPRASPARTMAASATRTTASAAWPQRRDQAETGQGGRQGALLPHTSPYQFTAGKVSTI